MAVTRNDAVTHRIRQARQRAGLSQSDMAERLGLSKAGFGHYDRGRQPYTLEMIFQIASILNVSVAWLIGVDTALSPDEDQLLTLYRAASPEQRRMILGAAKVIAGEE